MRFGLIVVAVQLVALACAKSPACKSNLPGDFTHETVRDLHRSQTLLLPFLRCTHLMLFPSNLFFLYACAAVWCLLQGD